MLERRSSILVGTSCHESGVEGARFRGLNETVENLGLAGGDETASVAVACTRSRDATDDDHDEGESDQDPDQPREPFDGVELSTVRPDILDIARETTTECLSDRCCSCYPKDPSQEQEDEMSSDARHDGVCTDGREHDEECRAHNGGPDRAEEDVSDSGGDCGEGIVVARVVSRCEPCCETQLDNGEQDDGSKEDGMSLSNSCFRTCAHIALYSS